MSNIINKVKRPVNKVYIHCSASDIATDDLYKLRVLHTSKKSKSMTWNGQQGIKCKGFYDIGYHFYIDTSGTVQKCRPLSKRPSAQKYYNTGSIAICVHGLTDFKKDQFESLVQLCNDILKVYPEVTFHGHCEVNDQKTCPVFDYKTILNLDENGKVTPVKGNKTVSTITLIINAIIEFINKFKEVRSVNKSKTK